ncbi:MAG: YXWGXW repeat-containing protein [Gammaproteobacteria bacterium]|nr:YXWGXW repeat-containing protein [Gammaproteobacteria bacterium]
MSKALCVLLLTIAALSAESAASADVLVAVRIAPPPLPLYSQPPVPGPDYLWIPGYWGWDADAGDYYWVPGTWVLAPQPGLLWTPGYWAWADGVYLWHPGYWAPQVGFYGGVDYGYGYSGYRYDGGYWNGPHFYYNRAVNNVNVTIVHYVYERAVTRRAFAGHISYNGGPGGLRARPGESERIVERERHWRPTPAQLRHFEQARGDRAQFAGVSHGRPRILAMPRAGAPGERGNGNLRLRQAPPVTRQNPPPRPDAPRPRAKPRAQPLDHGFDRGFDRRQTPPPRAPYPAVARQPERNQVRARPSPHARPQPRLKPEPHAVRTSSRPR